MLLEAKSHMVYQGVQEKTSQNGNTFKLVKLADPEVYETHDFFLRDVAIVAGFQQGDAVIPTFGFSKMGYRTSTDLLRLDKI